MLLISTSVDFSIYNDILLSIRILASASVV